MKNANDRDISADILNVIKKYFNPGAPSYQDFILFCRQMYSLLKSGVPIVRAFNAIIVSTNNKKLKNALYDVVNNIERGNRLGESLAQHPDIFPSIFISLVEVGENTGQLDEIFAQLSVYFERESETVKRIKSATRYPMFVIFAIAIALVIVNVFVIPAFSSFFSKMNTELPLPTRILIASSDITIKYWPAFILLVFALLFSFLGYINTTHGRIAWDRFKLKIPVFGPILKEAMLARFARSFALCQRTGVPLLNGMTVISSSTDNAYVQSKIDQIKDSIQRGDTLANSCAKSNLFSEIILQMITIGEETGELDRLLTESAEFYEREVDYKLKFIGDSIEPILITFIAGIVLVLALGIFLPMWDISKAAMNA